MIKGRVSAITVRAGNKKAELVDNIRLKTKREDGTAIGEITRKQIAGVSDVAV